MNPGRGEGIVNDEQVVKPNPPTKDYDVTPHNINHANCLFKCPCN